MTTRPVNTNSLEYDYANPGPGSVAANSSAVGQTTESTHDGNNPAFARAYEQDHGKGQQGADVGNQNPEAPEPAGATDSDNPAANENAGDQGPTTSRP